jgi:NADPH2:quinone reductase
MNKEETTMRAWTVGAAAPELRAVPRPVPDANQVLVRVRHAAINRADLHVAAGHVHGRSGGPGSTIGIEWAGEIAQIGADVPPGFTPGQRVMCSGVGGYAEYAATDWGRVYPLPPGLDAASAAALPIALQTAHEALTASGGFVRGETVLVHGASSGVGLMAMQIARQLGASAVVATSTTPERQARLREFGATHVVDARAPGWADQVLAATGGEGAHLVIDFIAGPGINETLRATRILGRIVNVGRMGGFKGEFDFDLHSLRRIRYVGATFRTRSQQEVREIAARMRADLWDALSRGDLRLPVAARYPLEAARAALDFVAANAHFGKVVLDL